MNDAEVSLDADPGCISKALPPSVVMTTNLSYLVQRGQLAGFLVFVQSCLCAG